MNAQPEMFPAARRTDPRTSHDAAARIAQRAGSWRRQVMESLAVRPMTDDELCEANGVPSRWWPSMKTARSSLKKAGLVVASGEVRGNQTVWKRSE